MHLHASGSDQDDLQAQCYGREDGTLDKALPLIDPHEHKLILLDWFYTWPYSNVRINGSLALEWGAGFEAWGCPYNDDRNIECWARAFARRRAGTRAGMFDTNWDKSYAGIVPTAAAAWHLVRNESLVC